MVVEPLVEFFRPVVGPVVEKRPEPTTKAWEFVIPLVIILGEWFLERYILDNFADRIEEWWQATSFYWRKAGSKRPLSISVKFEGGYELTVAPTLDEGTLKHIWQYAKQADQVYEDVRRQNIRLGRIEILPDGTKTMLVVGYVEGQPKYIIELKNRRLREFNAVPSADETMNVSAQLWMLEQLILSLNYVVTLKESGRATVPEPQISELAREIAVAKRNILELSEKAQG